MADLSQTAANVGLISSGGTVQTVQAGEAITQGMPVYENTSSSPSKWYQADANASAEASAATAFALTPASTDGYFVLIKGNGAEVNLGATLTVGETYVVSATKGAVAPIGDLTTGDFPTILGTATATNTLKTNFSSAGVAKP